MALQNASQTASSSLQRSSTRRDPGPHDLTGRRQIQQEDLAAENAQAVDAAVRELRSGDTQLAWVTVAGRGSRYPVPVEVLNAIRRSAR